MRLDKGRDSTDEEIPVYSGQWVDLKLLRSPQKNINNYEMLHEKRSNGHIVAIMPYFSWANATRYLLRQEMVPPWDTTRQVLCALTGGVDLGDDVVRTAIKELHEESGYRATQDSEWLDLGNCYGTKSTDTIYHLLAINVRNLGEPDEPEGDGSKMEGDGTYQWVDDLRDCVDPLAYVLYCRLNRCLAADP